MNAFTKVMKMLDEANAAWQAATDADDDDAAKSIETEVILPLKTTLAGLALAPLHEQGALLDKISTDLETALVKLQKRIDRLFVDRLIEKAEELELVKIPTVSTASLPQSHSAPASAAPSVDPNKRDTDLAKLHPVVREKVRAVLKDLEAASVPMKVFEAFRTPERQRMLFSKGRKNGKIVDRKKVVTFADAWRSYHQYGLAVDLVIDNPPMNMWETAGKAADWWKKYHEIAEKRGLEPLSFELPHVQMAGTRSSALLAGEYPDGGDDSWSDNLAAAINRWPETDKPPPPDGAERPAIAEAAARARDATAGIDWSALPAVRQSGFTSRFGGQSWRVDDRGVYLAGAPDTPLRTPGTPSTTSRVIELYGDLIAKASQKYDLAPELVVMTIATETALFRKDNFTGPNTFRWEAHFKVGNVGDGAVDGKATGDYSAGPMQVMADTARGLTDQESLPYDKARDFPFFKSKPSKAPTKLGLYDPAISIDVGACYIARQSGVTEGNPILVAAAYNAGSLRASGTSIWGLHATHDHLDRAAKWYGDACEVLSALGRQG